MLVVFALAASSSFVAPTGRCFNPIVPTRTVRPAAQEKVDAPVVAVVAALAVAGVMLPDVSSLGQLGSGQLHYSSWAATAVAIPATVCILIPFFGAFEVQEGSKVLRLGLATLFSPTAASVVRSWHSEATATATASLIYGVGPNRPAGPWALLTSTARDADKADKALMAKARAAMALTAELAEDEADRCVACTCTVTVTDTCTCYIV